MATAWPECGFRQPWWPGDGIDGSAAVFAVIARPFLRSGFVGHKRAGYCLCSRRAEKSRMWRNLPIWMDGPIPPVIAFPCFPILLVKPDLRLSRWIRAVRGTRNLGINARTRTWGNRVLIGHEWARI